MGKKVNGKTEVKKTNKTNKKLSAKEKKYALVMRDQCAFLIESIISVRGNLPEYVNDDDVRDFANEQIEKLIVDNRPNLPSLGDLRILLEQSFSETFYNVKVRAGLGKRKPVSGEASLSLTAEQEAMFGEYVDYVDSVIHRIINVRFLPSGIDFEDLQQHGLIALARAIKSYDPEQGEFIPYAKRLIRNALYDTISNYSDKSADQAVSLNAIIDDGKTESEVSDMIQGQIAKKAPSMFLTAEDEYEVRDIIQVIASIRDKAKGCTKIGLDAILKCEIEGCPALDYAESIGKPAKLVSAYKSKARLYLATNAEFLSAIGRSSI